MPNKKLCKRLHRLLADILKRGFKKDLSQLLTSREHELWIMGINEEKKKLTDICGTIDPNTLQAINAKGFSTSDAGFRVSAQEVLPLDGKKADIFLINKVHYNKPSEKIEALIVHELAHFLEGIGERVPSADQDEEHATAILDSLEARVLSSNSRHNREWALLLATAARELVQGGRSPHRTVGAFLEAALPHYDRTGPVKAMEESADAAESQ